MSHSDAIAQGLRDLLRQFAGDDVPIIAAGGGPDGSLGTDGDRIATAIAEAGAGVGAIVLMDMGSAVLSVKGALADADGVRARWPTHPSLRARSPQRWQRRAGRLSRPSSPRLRRRVMSASSEPAAETTATLPDNVALHARPAGVVSREAMQFPAQLTLYSAIKGGRQVGAAGDGAGRRARRNRDGSRRGRGRGRGRAHLASVISSLQDAEPYGSSRERRNQCGNRACRA